MRQRGFGTAWDWKERDLQDFFKHNVTDSARIRLYIDALDECGEENAIKLVDYFDSITSESNVVDASLSICFSCRHYPLVSSDVGLQICVEDEVNQDIEVYIQNVMWRQIRDKSRADEARDEIMSKSHGNFQWVVLVVPRVLQMCKRGRYREIKKIIQAIPSDLGELYKSLLEEVTDVDLPRTLKLIQWICFAEEPLSLEELRIATVVDMNTPYRSIRECQEDEHYADTDEEMARRVVDLSKGLAEVREHNGKRVAQFNHQSVKDYVLQGGLQVLEKISSGSAAGRAHFQLSRSCIKYINMEEIMACRVEPSERDSDEDLFKKQKDLEGKFPFLRSAVQRWFVHARAVEREGLTQEDLLTHFHEPSRNLMQLWIDLVEIFGWNIGSRHLGGTTLLHLASEYNLHSVAKVLLSLDNIDANPKTVYNESPLHYAALQGHEAIVRLLLKRNDIKVNLRDFRCRTPLSYASWHGHETVVRLLLERAEIEADSVDREDMTPLCLAVRSGHETVVRLLLERDDVMVDSMGLGATTPLLFVKENEAMARLLQQHNNVGTNPRNAKNQRSLFYTVNRGNKMKTVMKLLLEQKDVESNFKDDQGRAPLSHAGEEEDLTETIVRLLMEQKDIEADFKDDQDRTPLSYAAGEGDKAEKVVELLLRRNDVDVNFKDAKGRSPLSYAAEKGDESKAVVTLLLKRGDVDANSKDAKGRTPLSYAASKGNTAETVMKSLLQQKDIEADPKDIKNRTPLSYAAEWADKAEGVVRLLLERNDVDAEHKDSGDQTPILYAFYSRFPSNKVTRLLRPGWRDIK